MFQLQGEEEREQKKEENARLKEEKKKKKQEKVKQKKDEHAKLKEEKEVNDLIPLNGLPTTIQMGIDNNSDKLIWATGKILDQDSKGVMQTGYGKN